MAGLRKCVLMAFIPDEAIDDLGQLTKGARLYFIWLCRVRNQKTGKCFPSVQTTMECLGINRGSVYALRKELQEKSWAIFDGNNAELMKGFNSPKNQTAAVDTAQVIEFSPKNQTEIDESLKNQTDQSEKSDFLSEKSDSYIRNNQQIEPAKLTKEIKPRFADAIDEVFSYWQSRLNHPQAKLTPKRQRNINNRLKDSYTVDQIKTAIDGCAMSPFHQGLNDTQTVYDDIELICRDGEKIEKFIGIYETHKAGGNNGINQRPVRESANARAARETLEAIGRLTGTDSGGPGFDSEDATPPRLALAPAGTGNGY